MSSEEQAHVLEDKVFEQSNQLVRKGAALSGYQERIVILEKLLKNALAKVDHLNTQHMVEKNLFDGDHTAFAFCKKASKQRVSADSKNHEKLLADKAAIDTMFRKFPKDK